METTTNPHTLPSHLSYASHVSTWVFNNDVMMLAATQIRTHGCTVWMIYCGCTGSLVVSSRHSNFPPSRCVCVCVYKGVFKSFRTGRLERELQMVRLSATRCSCIAILWVSAVNFAAIIFFVASQRVFIVNSLSTQSGNFWIHTPPCIYRFSLLRKKEGKIVYCIKRSVFGATVINNGISFMILP
jgi:hypothetical protein